MVANVLHTTQATIADSADAELGKTHWNAVHTDTNGNTLEAIIGPFTFATLPAAAASYTGVVARVSDVGRTGGSLWMSDGTIWRPVAPVKIYENTALVQGANSASEQIVLAMPYAANILTGKLFRVLITFSRNNTTDNITTALRMGTAGTTADTSLGAGPTGLTGTIRSVGIELWCRMDTVTSIQKLGIANFVAVPSWVGSGSGVAVPSAVTVTTVASAGYIDISMTAADVNTKPEVGYCAIEIMQ